MASHHHLSAREAATELGISLPTLYAYVSRGLIRSEATENARTRRYHVEDIQTLKGRKEQRREPQKIAEHALHWGAPVMESAISLIADGRLYYRGRDAVGLATSHAVEPVAWLIWTGQLTEPQHAPATPPRPPDFRGLRQVLAHASIVDAFQVVLPLAAVEDLAAYDLRPIAVAHTGMRLLRLLAAIATNQAPSHQPIVETLQQNWVPDRPQVSTALNAALILCADHELNVSSFTARCVASAGSTPYAVVTAGLAALQGPKHGGHTGRAAALLQEVGTPERARPAIADRLRRGEAIPGFGHQLYPAGDPRGAALLQLAADVCPDAPALQLATAVAQEVREVIGDYPNLDFGLATLAHVLQLPRGAALALFALGRTIGWIGHAIEQYQENRMIRPRARYVGESPRSQ